MDYEQIEKLVDEYKETLKAIGLDEATASLKRMEALIELTKAWLYAFPGVWS